EKATTMSEGKSVRSLRVGSARGVCGVARLGRGINHAQRRAPCIRSLAEPTRLTWNTQTGSWVPGRHAMSPNADARMGRPQAPSRYNRFTEVGDVQSVTLFVL